MSVVKVDSVMNPEADWDIEKRKIDEQVEGKNKAWSLLRSALAHDCDRLRHTEWLTEAETNMSLLSNSPVHYFPFIGKALTRTGQRWWGSQTGRVRTKRDLQDSEMLLRFSCEETSDLWGQLSGPRRADEMWQGNAFVLSISEISHLLKPTFCLEKSGTVATARGIGCTFKNACRIPKKT